jgi:hypothetical protein
MGAATGLGQVPVTIQEEHAAKVALQALELRGYAALGQLTPDELFFEAEAQGTIVPSPEQFIGAAAALAGHDALGRRRGFFKGLATFHAKALAPLAKLTPPGVPNPAAMLAQKFSGDPKAAKVGADAVIAHRALVRGGAPTTAAQNKEADIVQRALLQVPGGGGLLAASRTRLHKTAQGFGVGGKFAALTTPPLPPSPVGAIRRFLRGFGRRR